MKVLFIDTVHPILSEELSALGWECIHAENETIEQCKALLPEMDGLVIRSRFPINEAVLRTCKNLKFIARSGAGMENIDVSYSLSLGIELFNAPEGNRNAVGEHALGMLLSLLNHLHTSKQQISSGIWDRFGNTGEELDGKTIGIIGYGHNGARFATKLRGFDVTVLAYDKYKSGFGDDFVRESTLESIQENADIISFHVPQNSETIYYFNEEFLDHCHKPIYLINVSRGKVVKSAALVKGLKTGQVKAAGLDVHEDESTSFDLTNTTADLQELIRHPSVLLTPHVAGWTKESYFNLSKTLSEKIQFRFLAD
ncbi:MAG: phosphoglycerate dehydrogenase [Bacteroidetes bacterium]|nr:phosphoglycerate dehydrogenase [Bacteroidota bacterium]